MATLSTCLRAAGTNISKMDEQAIKDAYQDFKDQGIPSDQAALRAVEEVINLAINERNEIADQANKKGARVEHIAPYELPENAQEALGMAQEQLSEAEEAEERKFREYQERKRAESKEAADDRAQSSEVKPVEGVKVQVKKKRKLEKPPGFDVNNVDWDMDNSTLDDANWWAVGLDDDAVGKRNSQEMKDIFGTFFHFGMGNADAGNARDVVLAIKDVLADNDPLRVLIDGIIAAKINLKDIRVQWGEFNDMQGANGPIVGRYRTGTEAVDGIMEDGMFTPGEVEPVRIIELNHGYGVGVANGNFDAGSLLRVFMHELTHSATVEGVMNNKKLKLEMTDLMNKSIALAARMEGKTSAQMRKQHYGFLNVKEFIAEAFTNPEFQNLLASLEYKTKPEQEGLFSSIWEKFIDLVSQTLNRPVSNTMLEQVIRTSESAFVNYETIREVILARDAEYTDAANMADEQIESTMRFDKVLGRGAGVITSALSGNSKKKLDQANNQLREGGIQGKQILLGFLTNDTILREFGAAFNNLRPRKQADGTLARSNPLKDYIEAKQTEQAEAKKFERSAELMHNNWRKVETKYSNPKLQKTWDKFNDLILEATMFQVHPDANWDAAVNSVTRENIRQKKSGQIAHKRLREAWHSLPADLKALYKEARNFYTDTSEKMRIQAIDSIADMYELDNPALRKIMRQAKTADALLSVKPPVGNWDKIANMIAKLNENMVANGPYFPLNRFGDWSVAYESVEEYSGYSSKEKAYAAAQEAAAKEGGSVRGKPVKVEGGWKFFIKVPGYSLFESLAEAEQFKADLEAEGIRTSNVTKRQEMKIPDNSIAGQIMAIAERKMVGEGAERGKMVMREALIHMLPETSISKRFLKRKNIAGANKNHRRAFASYVQSAGWHLAGMKHRRAIDTAFVSLMDAGKGKVNSNVTMEMSQVVKEMSMRHNMNSAKSTRYGRGVAKFGFINFLLSASYSMINATQPFTMTLPHLGGKYGTARATRALSRAYGMVYSDIGKAIMQSKGGLSAFDSISGEFDLNVATEQVISSVEEKNPQAAKMLRELADRGIIDATFALEVSEAARSEQRGMLDKVVEAGRVVPFAVEIMNRSTTAIAAYELAVQAGKSHQEATAQAREAVVMTQFDYTELNRPRYFVKNDVLRAMTMFKIHPLGVYSFMAHNVRKSLGKNASVEQRREAAKTLALMMFTHGSLAGAAGSLLMEPVRIALAMLAPIFELGDDDEYIEWMREPEVAMRELLYEATGSKDIAEVITHGLPRAVGIDVSTRIGLQNMILQWGQGSTRAERITDTVVGSIMGPLFGTGESFTRGFKHLAEGGDTMRSMEYFMPKALRDILRTYRYANTGMTDWNGNVIQSPEQFSAMELAGRFLGFGTSTETETYMARMYIQSQKNRMMSKIKSFKNRYANAGSRREQQEIWEEIQAYNKSLPPDMRRAYRLTRAQLVRSMQERKRVERQLEKGTRFSKKERAMKERIEWANP